MGPPGMTSRWSCVAATALRQLQEAAREERAHMHVAPAQLADIPAWLDLAAEVEPLFGPMVADPGFHAALERHIRRQTAFCIREQDGAPGTPFIGGLLFSIAHAPRYKIGWLAVSQRWRRPGAGQALVDYC